MRDTVGSVDQPGPEGITTRAIVESAAFLVQKKANWAKLSPAAYLEVLKYYSPSPLYRSAYDLAYAVLGEDALDAYSYLSYLALCTYDPPTTFVGLCEDVAKRSLARNGALKTSAIARLLDERNWKTLGTAAEVAAWFPPLHAVYTPVVKELDAMHAQGGVSLDEYMITPHVLTLNLLRKGQRPMIFNGETESSIQVVVSPTLWPAMSDKQREEEAMNLVAIAAISAKVGAV
jgi:hypothetical protein